MMEQKTGSPGLLVNNTATPSQIWLPSDCFVKKKWILTSLSINQTQFITDLIVNEKQVLLLCALQIPKDKMDGPRRARSHQRSSSPITALKQFSLKEPGCSLSVVSGDGYSAVPVMMKGIFSCISEISPHTPKMSPFKSACTGGLVSSISARSFSLSSSMQNIRKFATL